MKARLIFLLALSCHFLGETHEAQQRWATNLREEHSFQTFDRLSQQGWPGQQGVVFLTPDRLAVYQVNERLSLAPLAGRDASGGAGNFFLELRILDVHDGHEIQSMRFPTNASFSRVIAGHAGNFLVRTGDVLYLLSPAFKILASKALPLERVAPFEQWQVRTPHLGTKIVLVHQQLFIHESVLADGTLLSPGKSKADVEILDADTLKVVKAFSLPDHLAYWSAGDGFLVGTHPSQPRHAEEFGILNFDGQWKELRPPFKTKIPCPPLMDALDHQLIVAYGCNGIVVFSESGEQIFYSNGRANEWPLRVAGSGNYLAVEFHSLPNIHNSKSKPSHIDLFDLKSGARLIALSLQKNAVYHDVSAQGSLAVVEGDTLRVFAPGNE
ncbi:MAG TPA: hypothetical protein VG488_09370 [Candidatus Angelobacter sp.]|jgi:hypothetical protein|nr:hypothetical protein [Candidatus Angelobacter sp.]